MTRDRSYCLPKTLFKSAIRKDSSRPEETCSHSTYSKKKKENQQTLVWKILKGVNNNIKERYTNLGDVSVNVAHRI